MSHKFLLRALGSSALAIGMLGAPIGYAQNAGQYAGEGRRAVPAPVLGAESPRNAQAESYLVVLNERAGATDSVANNLPIQGAPEVLSGNLYEVLSEAIGLGAAIHATFDGERPSFYASLDTRSKNWLVNHPSVAFLDANPNSELLKNTALNIGGREFAPGLSAKAATNTRVLMNGAIVGYGVSGYQEPVISIAGNMFADAAEVLRSCDYSIGSNGASLTATKGTWAAGPHSIRFNSGSSTMTLATSSGQTTTVALPETAYTQSGKMMVPARLLLQRGCLTSIIDWDQDTRSLQTYYYHKLDTGIYFYGVQQNAIRTDQPGTQKYIAGQPNPFFDPNKPTIIYSHGWQKGGTTAGGREGFLFTEAGNWQNVQNYWLTRGWNVGIFQWVQLADDDFGAMPVDSEKKIYDANSTGIGMRWKNASGNFSNRGNPTTNVTQIYRSAYLQVASALTAGKEIRLIGNSLGGNLTVAMVRELAISGQRLPLRITLQDPYWDGQLDGSDGMTVPGGLRDNRAVGQDGAARIFNAGLALEYFRSSIAGQAGYNPPVAQIASYTNLIPNYTGNPLAKHTQPTRVYLWPIDNGGITATPNTPYATVRDRMNTTSFWDQAEAGSATGTPADDGYVTRTGKPQ